MANKQGRAVVAGLLGAVIVHPLVFLLVFIQGSISGAERMATGPGQTVYGVEGGQLTVLYFFINWYLGSCGMLPLFISGVGACFAAVVVGLFFPSKEQAPQITKNGAAVSLACPRSRSRPLPDHFQTVAGCGASYEDLRIVLDGEGAPG
jgi:hypothetical protein